MKAYYFLLLGSFLSCNSSDDKISQDVSPTPSETPSDVKNPPHPHDSLKRPDKKDRVDDKIYENQRFRNVRVTKLADDRFQITGQGQIFEANFGWVIEDGHDELQTGHHMTDAGAPEWGNFDFTVTARKKRANSTLHLILFESSAEDGRRVYELPLKLY